MFTGLTTEMYSFKTQRKGSQGEDFADRVRIGEEKISRLLTDQWKRNVQST